MTGNQLLLAFDEIVAADLFPISATTASSKLHFLNVAMDRVMGFLGKISRTSSVNYVMGTTLYPLASMVPPILLAQEVYQGTTRLEKCLDPFGVGWNQNVDSLEIYGVYPAGTVFKVIGVQGASPIVDSGVEVSDIPVALHLPIVQLAVVFACGAIEDTNEQIGRLRSLRQSAMDVIAVYSGRQARSVFGF
jgi:hypothetical protein